MARGEGLRVRFSSIKGVTPKGVLTRPLYLPATIGDVAWTEEAQHSEYDTVRAGQFSQPAMGGPTARRLRQFDDFETLTLTWDPSWLVEEGHDPQGVRDALYAVLRSKKPVELLATLKFGAPVLIRADVTFRSVRPQLRGGEPDTIYYTVKIAEWRNGSTIRKGSDGDSKLPTTHILTATDSLYSLSKHYYDGSASGWDNIARANKITGFGKKTALVKHKRFKVGSKVKIPKITPTTVRIPEQSGGRG